MKVRTEMKGVAKKVNKIGHDSRVGTFMASEMKRLMSPYVPMDTGMLYQNTVVEPFKVTYTQDYAKRLYWGHDLNISKEKHPLATAEWDKAMIQAHGQEYADAISNYIKRL